MEDGLPLYGKLGWIHYVQQSDMLEKAIWGSLDGLAAFNGDRLVGFLRIVEDGVSIIFVQDILVLLEYQRQGVNRTFLEMILEKYQDIYQLHLLTDRTEKTMRFCESLGMISVENLGVYSLYLL